MAIVKVRFVQHSSTLVNYVLRERDDGDIVDGIGCLPESAAEDFRAVANFHGGKGSVQAIHVIQSWSEFDSKYQKPEFFTDIGKKMADQYFPGHDYLIVTHARTGKTHNHIIVNPWNTETGKKIENKKVHLYNLRGISDSLCLEKGLNIIQGSAKSKETLLPDKVQRMMKFNGKSFLFDLCQKADFARAYATSYDEYVGVLSEFGITTRVENKNITYFYPGKERGKRGANLGVKYDKQGLETAFKTNDMKFEYHQGLKECIQKELVKVKNSPGLIKETADYLSDNSFGVFQKGAKDYSKFTKEPRMKSRDEYPHERELGNSLAPHDELRRARRESIVDYCKLNSIPLEKGKNGSYTLKGKEFVEIHNYHWVNQKNRTEGSLIEFVAAYKNKTFLQAVAEINHNPRLLLLEQHFGEVKRPFTSFYVPSKDQMDHPSAITHLSSFLRDKGVHERLSGSLLDSKMVEVSKSGAIRFFAKDDSTETLEFSKTHDGSWSERREGVGKKPFFSLKLREKRGVIFLDPISFMKNGGRNALSMKDSDLNVLCLLGPNEKLIDQFVADNPSMKHVTFCHEKKEGPSHVELDLFNNLKHRYEHLHLELDLKAPEIDLSRGFGLERSLF